MNARPRSVVRPHAALPASLPATLSALLLILPLAGCGNGTHAAEIPLPPAATQSLRVALVAPSGTTPRDEQIRAAQAKVRATADVPSLERLATLFIDQARRSSDPGPYKQAEACADVMTARADGKHAGALVRGHVRHALHDFAGAERIARTLVAERGLFLDHGLLGDVQLDLGRLDDARTSYQKMLDLRPGLQSYARAAQVRWLAGDIDGCRELLALASTAGSNRDPESLAWVLTRRACLELQANDAASAARLADEALALVADYPAARLARGRAALASDDVTAALPHLAAAAASYPLPEHLWAHADALRTAGRAAEAATVEAELLRSGATEDPRTFAVWLATESREPGRALQLANAELQLRQDPHTQDSVAFARFRNGDVGGAHSLIQQALASGIRDARLFVHAALIAEAAGDRAAAHRHREDAEARRMALLPGERRLLADLTRRW